MSNMWKYAAIGAIAFILGGVMLGSVWATSSLIEKRAISNADGSRTTEVTNSGRLMTNTKGKMNVKITNADALKGAKGDKGDAGVVERLGFSRTTLDDTGEVGNYPSITIGTDGLGIISYRDNTNQSLKVAHCADTACTSATTSPLDTSGNVGKYTSITIGTDGLGLISYRDMTNTDLKVAHCSNSFCVPFVRHH